MKTQQAQVQPQALWQALSPRQQQQLLALLEKWTLRCWKNHPPREKQRRSANRRMR
jgi:TRAP-type C4-dicarboxylate transport system substrate-binding protein